MPTHAQSAIIAKIKRLENERKQVMAHLHLLDDNIETLCKLTTLELTGCVIKLDSMDGLPQDKHVKAVKSVLYKLQKDGVVVKSKDGNGQIVWQWAN